MQFLQASILLNIQQNVAKMKCQRGKSHIKSALSVFATQVSNCIQSEDSLNEFKGIKLLTALSSFL